jgi:hypothetical protein
LPKTQNAEHETTSSGRSHDEAAIDESRGASEHGVGGDAEEQHDGPGNRTIVDVRPQ